MIRYTVSSDEYLIHDSNNENFQIVNPKLELEINKTGSFTFDIYPSNPNYNSLKKLKSIIQVFQNGKLIFRGRILNTTEGFFKNLSVVCEGELAFLLDSIQRPYDFFTGENHTTVADLFRFFIENHNSQVDSDHQFTIGEITVQDENDYIVRSDSTYLNTWESIQTKLIESLGGYLRIRHENGQSIIDYLADFDELAEQRIEFGKNLIDINQKVDGDDIATAIIPLGAKIEDSENRVTISEVNNGIDFVYNQNAVDLYGWIFKTVSFENITLPQNLLRKANEYLNSSINLIKSIELSAIDLSMIEEIDAFRIGEYVTVVSVPQDINSDFMIQKMSISLDDPKSNKLTLGKTFTSLTEQNRKYQQTLNEIQSGYNVFKAESTSSAEEIQAKLDSLKNETDESKSQTEAQLELLNKYFRFQNGTVIIGENGSGLTVAVSNGKLVLWKTPSVTNQEPNYQNVTLLNSWQVAGNGHSDPKFYKDFFGNVHFVGACKLGVNSPNTVLFTLPADYSPLTKKTVVGASGNGETVTIDIETNGNVIMMNDTTNAFVSFDGIIFER